MLFKIDFFREKFRQIDSPNFLAAWAFPPEVVLFLPSDTKEVEEVVLPFEGLGLGIRLGGRLLLCCKKCKQTVDTKNVNK